MPILAALAKIGTLGFVGLTAFDVIKGLMGKDSDKTKYTQTAEAIEAESGLPVDDVKKLSAMTMYSELEEKGQDPDNFWDSLSAEAREEIKWSPEQLRRIEGIATFGAITTGFAWVTASLAGAVTGLGGVILSGKVLQQIGKAKLAGTLATELPTIMATAKFTGIKFLAIPALVAGIAGMAAWLTPQISNQLEDPGIWGRIMLEQLEQKRLQNAGGGFKTDYAQVSKTRTTTYKTAKPKLFLGILYAGQVGKFEQFVRQVDDSITSEQDLRNDVQINLTKYISTIDNNLSYAIQIKNSPADELGVPKTGTWATLSIYFTNQFHKRLFLDEILLGPIEPTVYYPETQIVTSIQHEVPKLVDFEGAKIGNIMPEKLSIVDVAGNKIADVVPGSGPATPPAPPTGNPAKFTTNAGKVVPGVIDPLGVFTPWPTLNLGSPEDIAVRSKDGAILQTPPPAPAPAPAPVVTPTNTFPKLVRVGVNGLAVRSAPNTWSSLEGSQRLNTGDEFWAVALVDGEVVTGTGNGKWWKSAKGNYVWSGGTNR